LESNYSLTSTFENETVHRLNFYNNSIHELKLRFHNDSVDVYFSINEFYYITNDYNFLSLNTENDILSSINSIDNSSVINAHIKV